MRFSGIAGKIPREFFNEGGGWYRGMGVIPDLASVCLKGKQMNACNCHIYSFHTTILIYTVVVCGGEGGMFKVCLGMACAIWHPKKGWKKA